MVLMFLPQHVTEHGEPHGVTYNHLELSQKTIHRFYIVPRLEPPSNMLPNLSIRGTKYKIWHGREDPGDYFFSSSFGGLSSFFCWGWLLKKQSGDLCQRKVYQITNPTNQNNIKVVELRLLLMHKKTSKHLYTNT